MDYFKSKFSPYKWILVCGIIFLFVSQILLYQQLQALIQAQRWQRHADVVIGYINNVQANVLGSLVLIENYLTTKQSSFLAQYKATITRSQQGIQLLKKLTKDNSQQQKNLIALEAAFNNYLTQAQVMLASHDVNAAHYFLLTAHQSSIRQINTILLTMKNIEEYLLTLRNQMTLKKREWSVIDVFVVSCVGDLILLLLLIYIVIQDRKNSANQYQIIRELTEKTHKIEEESRHKSEFLANMSHELRTPLNSIIGFSEIISNEQVGKISPGQKEFLNDILHSAQHLLQLINDVLDLSKIEAGKMKFYPEPIELSVLIYEVQRTLYQLIENKHLVIKINIDSHLKKIVLDPLRLKQVFYNYLSNAVKFTPDYGEITIQIKPFDETFFQITVEDTGIGIAEKDIHHLFVQFQQLDSGSGKKYAGIGIGLALTRQIVEAQGGRVDVKSVLHKGSIFYAILPYQMLQAEDAIE